MAEMLEFIIDYSRNRTFSYSLGLSRPTIKYRSIISVVWFMRSLWLLL